MSTVCLCMMVRNESHVIERALRSALPYVDAISIYDTGSTDNTIALVRAMEYGKPINVVQEGWVDFAHGRTRALRAAQEMGCDYLLIMDADQTLVVRDEDYRDQLTADGYDIDIHHANLVYPHPWLLSSRLNWRWEGATHEWLACDGPYTTGVCDGVYLVEHADSHRRVTGEKAKDDLRILEAANLRNPEDARTVFYLAQACADAGRLTCALKYYRQRVELGGWLEEAWCAQYRIGGVHEVMGVWEYAQEAYIQAWGMLPARAEPLYRLGRGLLMRKQFPMAYAVFDQAIKLRPRQGGLFIEAAVYRYLCRWGLSMSMRLLGANEEAAYIEDSIIGCSDTPPEVITEILSSRASKSIGKLP